MNYGRHTPPAKWWVLVCADVLVFAAALLTFAYFHHVIPKEGGPGVQITPPPSVIPGGLSSIMPPDSDISSDPSSGSESGETSSDTSSEQEPDYSYLGLGAKFYDKFILDGGEFVISDTQYITDRVHITINEYKYRGAVCHVADIYLCSLANYTTTFAKGKYGKHISESISGMAERGNAILAVNGDYYGTHSASFLVRNGVLYDNADADDDICVLYADGTMESYFEDDFDKNAAIERGVWQAWGFGPKLMENGKALSDKDGTFKFNSSVTTDNPRTAIGYYEPGHYCLVVVDGRSAVSQGLNMNELAAFMESIGCSDAFNLDGGQTSMMIFNGNVIGEPYKGGRNCSDIISIVG